MTRVRLVVLALTLALSAAAAMGVSSPKTIAVSPLEIPDGLDNPEPVRTLFDSLIAAEVQGSGFTVVPSAETGAIWKRLVDSVHGFYSALTGELVRDKYTAVVSGTSRELQDRFHAEVWLRPRIDVVAVRFEGGKARWDGADEGVEGGANGTVPALSLVVFAANMGGEQLYQGRGGIQVLRKGSGLKEVPRDKLFKDTKRNLKALHLALDSLLDRAHRIW
jgi:hypothetical protein